MKINNVEKNLSVLHYFTEDLRLCDKDWEREKKTKNLQFKEQTSTLSHMYRQVCRI